MATKQFKIKYNGAESVIELEDEPRAGTILKVTKPPIMKYKVGQAIPDIDFEEYYIFLGTNMITKAPWDIKSVDTLRNLPKSTFLQLCEILGNEFPLQDFLFPAGKLTYGKQLEMSVLPSLTESTTNSPSSESLKVE